MNYKPHYRVYAEFKKGYGFVFDTFEGPTDYDFALKTFNAAKKKGCYKKIELIEITEELCEYHREDEEEKDD